MRKTIEQGPRVYLRAPTRADRAEFVRLARESRELHRPWVYAPATPREFDAFVSHCAAPTKQCLLVCRRDDDALVGVYNISEIVRGFFENAYLGYYAFAPNAGRGLMADGLQLVLRFAFRRLKLHRLEANIQPDNERSKRLVERAGFRYEGYSPRYLKIGGRWRDHEHWAITREEWIAR